MAVLNKPDFSKIFGSNASSVLAFTDENYLKGWEYLGQEPPSYQLFNHLQNRTDTRLKWLADSIDDLLANSATNTSLQSAIDTHNTDSSAHTAILNAHNADVNAHNPITDMIASITGELSWQAVPAHNLATVLNDSVKRAVDILAGRADVILTPLIDWERIKTEKGGTDARTGDPTNNYLYALMKGSDVVGGKIYLKTAFTDYDELIFRLTDDTGKGVGDCTYNTKEFYEILNGKGEAVYIIGGAGIPGNATGQYASFWGLATFNNPFSAFKSTVNYLCVNTNAGWENCGLVEIYGVTYPRA